MTQVKLYKLAQINSNLQSVGGCFIKPQITQKLQNNDSLESKKVNFEKKWWNIQIVNIEIIGAIYWQNKSN